jgi:hypothetical protein
MAKAKKSGTRPQSTKQARGALARKPAEKPSRNTSKKLFSELTDEEYNNLTDEEFGDLVTEQMIHSLKTHTPHGSEKPSRSS